MSASVPKAPNGGPALCHRCQRHVYMGGGFLGVLIDALEAEAKDHPTYKNSLRIQSKRHGARKRNPGSP